MASDSRYGRTSTPIARALFSSLYSIHYGVAAQRICKDWTACMCVRHNTEGSGEGECSSMGQYRHQRPRLLTIKTQGIHSSVIIHVVLASVGTVTQRFIMLRPRRLPTLLLPVLLLACLCGPLSCELQQQQPPPCVQPRINAPLLARHQGGSLILTDVCLDGYAQALNITDVSTFKLPPMQACHPRIHAPYAPMLMQHACPCTTCMYERQGLGGAAR